MGGIQREGVYHNTHLVDNTRMSCWNSWSRL